MGALIFCIMSLVLKDGSTGSLPVNSATITMLSYPYYMEIDNRRESLMAFVLPLLKYSSANSTSDG